MLEEQREKVVIGPNESATTIVEEENTKTTIMIEKSVEATIIVEKSVKMTIVTKNKSKLKKLAMKQAKQNVKFAKKAMYRAKAGIINMVDQEHKIDAEQIATVAEKNYKQTLNNYLYDLTNTKSIIGKRKKAMRSVEKVEENTPSMDKYHALSTVDTSTLCANKATYASVSAGNKESYASMVNPSASVNPSTSVNPSISMVNPSASEFTDKIVLFNYCDNKSEYMDKCKTIIDNMISTGLLTQFDTLTKDSMSTLRSNFNLDDWEFTNYDFDHITLCKPLIKSILANTPIILANDLDMLQLTKLVNKKYIITKQPTMKKIVVNVIVGVSREIKVIAYNTVTRGKYCFNDPKGSIEQDELPIDALLREMREELGFTFNIDRYERQFENKKIIKYTLNISNEECDTHFCNLDTSKLDPEITHIVLQDIVHR
jgi:hypothetical protein